MQSPPKRIKSEPEMLPLWEGKNLTRKQAWLWLNRYTDKK